MLDKIGESSRRVPRRAFPVGLDLTGRRVVVVGGGPVGRRKAAAARDAGAIVRVVAPEPRPAEVAAEIEWVSEPYQSRHLEGQMLVFAAATTAVNAFVVADATARQLWVCDSADPARGTFTTPAVGARGSVTVAVDTAGAAPALARRLRDRIVEQLAPAIADWAELLAEVRGVVLAKVTDARLRRALLTDFADWPWLERLQRDGLDATRRAMRQAVDEAAGRG